MTRNILRVLGLTVAFAPTIAGQAQTPSSQTIVGFIVATNCARAHGGEVGYARNHDKRCNLIEPCRKTGYSLVTAGRKVYILDQKGSDRALALLLETDKQHEPWLAGLRRDWRVEITGVVEGQQLTVGVMKPILY
jgi:hypothetical protein